MNEVGMGLSNIELWEFFGFGEPFTSKLIETLSSNYNHPQLRKWELPSNGSPPNLNIT